MLIQVSPEPPFGNVVHRMNQMIDQMQKGFYNFCPSETWTPDVNLYESEQVYIVCVDLAGVNKEEIDIEIAGSQLRVRGRRKVPTEEDAVEQGEGQGVPPEKPREARFRVHLMEIDHGAFCREVDLPENVDRDKIKARYRNGFLWIRIPKA